jgi:hypothetical protein
MYVCLYVGVLPESNSPDLATAAKNFLLVAPAAADPQLFANFSRIVNHYLEAPPFKFTNAFKNKGVLKNVRNLHNSISLCWPASIVVSD